MTTDIDYSKERAQAASLAKRLANFASANFAKKNKLGADIPAIATIGTEMRQFEPISTGIPPLDRITGGGICPTEIWELYGDEGAGKTVTANYIAGQFTKRGKMVINILSEEVAMPEQAWQLGGVDPELYVAIRQHEFAENTFDVVKEMVLDKKTKYPHREVGLIIIDSFAALLPEKEARAIEKKGEGADTMMTKASMAAKFFRSLAGSGLLNEAALLIVNQQTTGFAGTYAVITTPGGNAIRYFCKMRIRLKKPKSGVLTGSDGKTSIGHTIVAQVIKNNLGRGLPANSEREYSVIYGRGVDETGPIIREATANGIIYKKNKMVTAIRDIQDGKIVDLIELKGQPAVQKWIEENPAGLERISDLNSMVQSWMNSNPGIVMDDNVAFIDGVEVDLLAAMLEDSDV
jgi:RecA/RadA recombinase